MRVDPNGMDWVEDNAGNIAWDDKVTSQKEAKEGTTWLGKNVLVGTHNRDENLNEPINSARFDLYLESNKEGPTATIYGNTIPSDVKKSGTLAEGLYKATFGQRKKYLDNGEYDYGLLINDGKAVSTAPGSAKETMTEIFFHKGNDNRESLSTYSGSPYSKGCQTGGNYMGSHEDYKVFAQYLPGFSGTYYLRGKQQQKQSHYYVPFIDGIQGIISNKR